MNFVSLVFVSDVDVVIVVTKDFTFGWRQVIGATIDVEIGFVFGQGIVILMFDTCAVWWNKRESQYNHWDAHKEDAGELSSLAGSCEITKDNGEGEHAGESNYC